MAAREVKIWNATTATWEYLGLTEPDSANVGFSSATPAALGTATAGTATLAARGDHVHAMPTAANVGAVGTATQVIAGTALTGGGTLTGNITLNANLTSSAAAALGEAASAGTATTIARADHVHIYPSAANVGAVGTATTITAGTALAGGGDLSTSRTLNVVLASTTPAALGTASAGTATSSVARADHVHPTDGLVLASLVDAAGDLIVGSADNTVGRLALGTNGQVLTVDTAGSGVNKIKWAAASGSDVNPLFLAGV